MRHRFLIIATLLILAVNCGTGLRRSGGGVGGEGAGAGDGGGGSGGDSDGDDDDDDDEPSSDLSVSPTQGAHFQTITITGSGFAAGATVAIGGVTCTGPVVTSTQITCSVGAHSPGPADVVVTQGAETSTLTNGFLYRAFLYVTTNSDGKIREYEILENGSLTELASSPLSMGTSPTKIVLHPVSSVVFVLGGLATPTLATYGLTADSSLAELSGSPSTSNISSIGFAVSPDGNFLYQATGTTFGADVRSFAFQPDGSLTLVDSQGSGRSTTATRVSPDGNSIYLALNNGTHCISGYQVDSGGIMSEQASSPYINAPSPGDLVVSNDGKFVFQYDVGFGEIDVFVRNTLTGDLGTSSSTAPATPANTTHLFVHPTRNCLYYLDAINNSGEVFTWNQATGALLSSSTFATGGGPLGLAFDPGGTLAFTTNGFGNSLSRFSVGSDCSLTSLGAVQPVGNNPHGLTVQ